MPRLLSDAEINALVEPWIGKDGAGGRHSAAAADRCRGRRPARESMSPRWPRKLKQAAPHAMLDDHRRWIARLKGLADAVRCSRLWHPAADRGRHRRGGVLRHPRRAWMRITRWWRCCTRWARCPASSPARWSGIISSRRCWRRRWDTVAGGAVLPGRGRAGGLRRRGGAVPAAAVAEMDGNSLAAAVPAATALIAWATARISVLSVVRGHLLSASRSSAANR